MYDIHTCTQFVKLVTTLCVCIMYCMYLITMYFMSVVYVLTAIVLYIVFVGSWSISGVRVLLLDKIQACETLNKRVGKVELMYSIKHTYVDITSCPNVWLPIKSRP